MYMEKIYDQFRDKPSKHPKSDWGIHKYRYTLSLLNLAQSLKAFDVRALLMFEPAESFAFLRHLRFVSFTHLPEKIAESKIGDDTLCLISVTKQGGSSAPGRGREHNTEI